MPQSKTHSKRILSVKVRRLLDTDPDTSHLGEYSNTKKSEFSIDRAHSEDCAYVQPANESALQTLRNARAQIGDYQNLEEPASDEWEALEDAYNLLDHLADDMPECDCGGHGDMDRHEYRYFNPSDNYTGEPPEEIRKYVRQDYERMEDYNNQQWYYLGIRADAKIAVQIGSSKHTLEFDPSLRQTITSGGLWGIESDSDKSYFAEVESDELADLKTQLLALGFSKRAIATAFKDVEKENE